MKTSFFVAIIFIFLFLASNLFSLISNDFFLKDNYYINKAIVYKNVSVYPIFSNKINDRTNYLLLDEGVKEGLVKVRELGGGDYEDSASVNVVEIQNNSEKKLYLLSGEIILGGKQDRIISRDTIIPSKSTWTKVSVFCVEHGRWEGEKGEFSSSGSIADKRVRQKSQFKDQSAVWDEVKETNEALKTENSTGTYREVITNNNVNQQLESYFNAINSKFNELKNVVGMVYCANGSVEVIEMFNNPILFEKLRAKLLKSYIITTLKNTQVVERIITPEQILSFYKERKELKASSKKVVVDNNVNREEVYESSKGFGVEMYDKTSPAEEGEAEALHEMEG